MQAIAGVDILYIVKPYYGAEPRRPTRTATCVIGRVTCQPREGLYREETKVSKSPEDSTKKNNTGVDGESTATDALGSIMSPFRAAAPNGRSSYGYSYTYNSNKTERPITEYISVLVRFRYLLFLCVICGLAIGYRMHSRRQILFATSAMVNVGTYVPPTDGPTADAIRFEQSKGEYLQGLLPLLASNTIAKKVLLANPEIRTFIDPTFIPRSEAPNRDMHHKVPTSDFDSEPDADIPIGVLEGYLGHISTYNHDRTNLISMTATGPDPQMVAIMANAHAEAFMELVRQQRFVWATTNVEFLTKQLEALKKTAEETQTALDDFSRKNAIFVLNNSRAGATSQQRLELLISSLSETVLSRVTATEEARARRRALQSGGYIINGQTMELMGKLNGFIAERAKFSATNANRYYMKYLQGEIERIKSQLRSISNTEIQNMEIKAYAETQKESLIRRELEDAKELDVERSKQHLEYTILEREAKAAQENLVKMQTRLEEAMINAESDQKTVLIVDTAVAPDSPLPAKRVSTLLSGLLFGLLLGIALAFFLDFHNARVRTVSDLSRLVDAPVLGVIPSFSRSLLSWRKLADDAVVAVDDEASDVTSLVPAIAQHDDSLEVLDSFTKALDVLRTSEAYSLRRGLPSGQSNLILVAKPHSRESEAFRNLRATLKYSNKQGTPKLVLVTSGQKGDGKTTVAVNLAAALAQTSSRTIIIDADLRMPTVHKHFRQPRGRQGLADYLATGNRLETHIHPTEIPHLKLIPAGSVISNPAELLGSKRFSDLLEVLADEYDHVIIDTPPVGEIADALLLCRNVDGVLMVTRSGVTPRTVAQVAVTRLQQVRTKILGTALNGLTAIDGVGEGYGSYYYRAHYSLTKE